MSVTSANKSIDVDYSIKCPSEEFFSKLEPSLWMPIKKNDRNNFTVDMPKDISRQSKLIYIFKNFRDNKVLIGKTGGELRKRINSHLTIINQYQAGDVSKETEFVRDLSARCKDFALGILYQLKSDEDINLCEDTAVKAKIKFHLLYNQKSGGGGGIPRSEEIPSHFSIPANPKEPVSPPSYSRIRIDQNGRIRPEFSELIVFEDITNKTCFYQFKNARDPTKRYIGVTNQFKKRILEHCYSSEEHCKKNEKKFFADNKGSRFHKALGKKPQEFLVGLIPVSQDDPEKMSPNSRANRIFFTNSGDTEKALIRRKRALFSDGGLNQNEGGGGPTSSQLLEDCLTPLSDDEERENKS